MRMYIVICSSRKASRPVGKDQSSTDRVVSQGTGTGSTLGRTLRDDIRREGRRAVDCAPFSNLKRGLICLLGGTSSHDRRQLLRNRGCVD